MLAIVAEVRLLRIGPSALEKTLRLVAQAQACGGVCALVDVARVFDPARASALGIRLDKLLVSCAEPALVADILGSLRGSGAVSLIVVVWPQAPAALVAEEARDIDQRERLVADYPGLPLADALVRTAERAFCPLVDNSLLDYDFHHRVCARFVRGRDLYPCFRPADGRLIFVSIPED